MDIPSLVAAAEELADSPDPINSRLAVILCYLATRSIEQLELAYDDELVRAGCVVADAWESAFSDGIRLISLTVLDNVLLSASTGELDVDMRDLEEINRARLRAGEPFRVDQ